MGTGIMHYSPRISVVIVTYNFAQYLQECIDSILAQTLQPFEIVVYDDCSTDDSWSVISAYRKQYPDLFVVHRQKENVGMHINVNSALQRARGDLVSCLDGDDRWLPRKLEAEWSAICRNPGARVAYSNVYSVDPDGRRTAVWHDGNDPEPPSGDVFVEVFSKRFFPGTRSIFRNPLMFRSDLEAMGYHDEKIELYIDWDLKIRLAATFPVAYSGEALVDYRIHEGGIHNQPIEIHRRDLLAIYSKNGHFLDRRSAAEKEYIESELKSLASEYGGSLEAVIRQRKAATLAAHTNSASRGFGMPPSHGGLGENLVFLVSLPRSGSTLLQRILAGHVDVYTTAEPWLMLHPLYALKRHGVQAEYDSGLARQALAEYLEILPGGEDTYHEAIRSMASVLYGKALESSGKRLFLDKTPRYFHILPELARVFPKAKFVLLLRNPLAVLSSMLRTWFGDDAEALRRHRHYTDLTEGARLLAEGAQVLGDRAVCVHYEDLVSDPDAVLRSVCKHIGIPFMPEMLDYGRQTPPAGSFGDSRSVHKHASVVGHYVDVWQEHLAHGTLCEFANSYLETLGRPITALLGYSHEALVSALKGEHRGSVRLRADRRFSGVRAQEARDPALLELIHRGECAFEDGDVTAASEAFQAAYRMAPTDPDVLNNLVVTHWQQDETEGALSYLAAALECDPFNRDTVVNGGQILEAMGEQEQASLLYESYLALYPDDEIAALRSALNAPAVHTGGDDDAAVQADVKDCDVLVTAIVSTFNSEIHMDGCLRDLVSQTIADRLEVIVIDSASAQNERAIVERYQMEYPCIRYVRTPQRETIYAAWNRAVKLARGRYLTNANTDDRHRRDAYERMVEVLENNRDVSLVYADALITHDANHTFENTGAVACFRWPEFDVRLLFSGCFVGPQPMWRHSLHRRYGYFDEQMKVAGDYDYWLRLAVAGEKFRHIPDALGLYLASPTSIEHACAEECARESEIARRRNLPSEWGSLPPFGRDYRVVLESGRMQIAKADDRPLISVIMPTKDRVKLLKRAIASVAAQSYTNWELLVVNDGGEDVSPVVDASLCHGRIRVITLDRSVGQAAARNIALRKADGEIICYLDDDDVYLPIHLETIVDALGSEGRMFIYTDAVVVPEEYAAGNLSEVGERSNPYKHGDYSRDRLMVNNYIPINTWGHRRECLVEAGLFDEALGCYEDWEFLLRLSRSYDFVHIRKTTVEVRFRVDRADNITRRKLADTEAAYRTIYNRYNDKITERMHYERAMKLEALTWDSGKRSRSNEGSGGRETVEKRPGEGAVTDTAPDRRLEDLQVQFGRRAEVMGYKLPSIHLVMLAEAGDAENIADTIDSLARQIYSGWGLSIVSPEAAPHGDFETLPMLEWIRSDEVELASVRCIQSSQCDWVGRIAPGDTLEPDALSTFVDYINLYPGWKYIYCDEDIIDAAGVQLDHKFKPDVNPELLRSCPYPGNLSLARQDVAHQLPDRAVLPAAAFYDLALKVLEVEGSTSIGHVPTLLFHQLKNNDRRERRELWVKSVLESYVQRNGINASVVDGLLPGTCMLDYRHSGEPSVCIAMHAGTNPVAVERSLSSILQKTACANWSVRLGVRKELIPTFSHLENDRVHIDQIGTDAGRCSYFNSLGSMTDAEFLVFMDPGVLVLQDNWLERLLAQGQRDEVGIVGIRLMAPDQTVAHAGILIGAGHYGVGDPIGAGATLTDHGYMQRLQVAQDVSAVSSACMLTGRSLFRSLGGFDLSLDVTLYQDLDYCLRAGEAGRATVWTPFVTMMLSEERLGTYSGEGGVGRVEQDTRHMVSRWLGELSSDRAYNRNLNLKRADFSPEREFVPVWDPRIRDVARITGCGAGSLSSWIYRVEQPLDALAQAGLAKFSHIPFSGEIVRALPSPAEMERMKPDVLLLHNTVHDHFMEALEKYRKINDVFVIFGQDDLMFAVPPKSSVFKSSYKDIKKRVRTCLALSDRLVVTSEALADELSGMIDDIRVVPNYLDANVWGSLKSARGAGRKPRVGWAGAQQHYGDLEVLAEVVRETAAEVEWVFMGMCPDFLRPYVAEVHGYAAFETYPETLAGLDLDLAVAPLERNRFNRCKSNLRLLEYGAMGWPVIATDIEPYRGAPVHLVSNQSRAWIKAIREHVNEPQENARRGDILREWVTSNFLQCHLDEWLDALDPQAGIRSYRNLASGASGR